MPTATHSERPLAPRVPAPRGHVKSVRRRSGFTLIELMVALAIFLLLLAIVFVPLNQAFEAFNAGRADINLQTAAQETMAQIQTELSKAIYVYPNDLLPGVTDALPYKNSGGGSNAPYYAGTAGTCDQTLRVGNRTRLDFILGKATASGALAVPVQPESYVVSYYCRRQAVTDSMGADYGFDPYDNPVVLFRAQMPYKDAAGAPLASGAGMNIGPSRYSAGGCDADWLRQNPSASATPTPEYPDEVDVTNVYGTAGTDHTADDNGVYGSNTQMTPRGMGLPLTSSPFNAGPTQASLKPDISFECADVNHDGKIDRVTVTLALEEYEQSNTGAANGSPRRHAVRLVQTIDLPNIQ